MQWFKHSTGSHDDPDLVDARNELGDKAIVIFWDILELYAEEFKHRDSDGWVRFSKFFLRSQLRRNLVTTQSVLSFYEKRGRIHSKFEGNFVYIQIPKFISLSSNWTRRPTEAPTEDTTEAPTESPTAIEEEEKKNRNKEKKGSNFVLPEWVPKESWDGFVESRKKKKPLTDRAKGLIVTKLHDLRSRGHDPGKILDESVEKGWMTVYEPKAASRGGNGSGNVPASHQATPYKLCPSCGKEVMPQDIEGNNCIHCAPRKPLSEIMDKIGKRI